MDGRKYTYLDAGGKQYKLRLSYSALCAFTHNIGSIDMLQDSRYAFEGYRGMVWAMANDVPGQEITIREAEDICEEVSAKVGFEKLVKQISDAIKDAGWLPSGEDADTKNREGNAKPSKSPSKSANE